MITTLYLAGASAEIDRARKWAEELRRADITVLSTWVDVIGKAGAANPTDATIEQLTKWTLRDVAEVQSSDQLWLLLPGKGIHTVGAYIELGIAYSAGNVITMSGLHRPIFTPVLCNQHFELDEQAFEFIQARHRERVSCTVRDHMMAHRGTPPSDAS